MKRFLLAVFAIFCLLSIGRVSAIAPCAEDPNKLCNGDPNNPIYLGYIDANEGEVIHKCLSVFDCNTGEQTGQSPYHYFRNIKGMPPGAVITGPTPVSCNSFDVTWAGDCKDANGSHCSMMYFDMSSTVGKSGTWVWLFDIDNKSGGRTYCRVDVMIRKRTTPNVHLGGCGG